MQMMKRLMLEQAYSGENALGKTSFNGGTGISIDIPDFNIGSGSSSSNTGFNTSTSTSGGGFFKDFNLNGLLDTLLKGGATWAQIEAAKNGAPVYVQGSNGSMENVTPELRAKLEAESDARNKSLNDILELQKMQLLNNNAQKPDKKDNTILYIAGGVGLLFIAGIAVMVANSNKNKN